MTSREQPLFAILPSPIAGAGAFALQVIPAHTRLIEYTGERVSHEVADARYDAEESRGNTHTVLFALDDKIVIDAGVGGNDARFFNHSCDPNCTSRIVRRRVYLETLHEIMPGEELTYDYEIPNEGETEETAREKYPCYCGAPNCRGTLLLPPAKPRRKAKRGTQKKKGRTPVTRSASAGKKQRRRNRGERRLSRAQARR
jgi:SET domain-containing protein